VGGSGITVADVEGDLASVSISSPFPKSSAGINLVPKTHLTALLKQALKG
jgi:hypothetical protein